jgi:hypothetical protein
MLLDLDWRLPADGGGFELEKEQKTISRRPYNLNNDSETIVAAAPEIAMTVAKPTRIVWRGSALKRYRPLDKFPQVFQQFAKVTTDRQLLEFMNRFGPLTDNGYKSGENVASILTHAQQIRRLRDAYEAGRPAALAQIIGPKGMAIGEGPIGDVQVRLIFDPVMGASQVQLAPRNLLNGIWLQLAGPWRPCQHCGELFQIDGNRSVKLFCKPAHRVAAHRQKHASSGAH